jgi:DNA-binding transcriptional regulator YiaG
MILRCDVCGVEMTRSEATVADPYHFKLSGLPNVFLVGIDVRRCPQCRAEIPLVPRMAQLTQTIAKSLIEKPTALTGDELRFLRKFAGMQSKEFAAQIRVDPSTYSRVETGKQELGGPAEKLARAVAAHKRHMKEIRDVVLNAEQAGEAKWERIVLEPTARGWREKDAA